MKQLISQGCQVFALAPIDQYVKKLRKNGISHINIKMSRSGINPFKDILLLLKFVDIYRKYKPDLIQAFTIKPNIYGTIAARIVRVKYIYNMITGLGYIFTGSSFKKLFFRIVVRFLYRRALAFSKHVYFQNNDDRNYFIKHKIVEKKKTSIVPGSGVDTQFFIPTKKRNENKITFILDSRMLGDKGVREFVEAAYYVSQKYKSVNFWLLGPVDLKHPTGIPLEQLENWNREGIVKYLGATDNVKPYLEKSNVIVLPSYREGIPLSLLEGAAMGMPIITTDSVGCREVVENGKNGYLVPTKDSKALASAMEEFIDNPSIVSRMGKESRKIVVKFFDVKIINRKILKYYPFGLQKNSGVAKRSIIC